MQENDPWLSLTDTEISSADLAAEVQRRVQHRRQAEGQIYPKFPEFGVLSPVPELPLEYAALAHHLRLANEMEPPPVDPLLAPSPATRTPLLGKLWQMVRAQFHELILFYVNRAASHETRLDNHIISVLNELTRIVQDQQQEIDELQQRIRQLEEEGE